MCGTLSPAAASGSAAPVVVDASFVSAQEPDDAIEKAMLEKVMAESCAQAEQDQVYNYGLFVILVCSFN